MSTFAGIGKHPTARKAFWKNNGFWIVVMPTTLVGLVFLLAMVATALGH